MNTFFRKKSRNTVLLNITKYHKRGTIAFYIHNSKYGNNQITNMYVIQRIAG
jgi:hypothetical protein